MRASDHSYRNLTWLTSLLVAAIAGGADWQGTATVGGQMNSGADDWSGRYTGRRDEGLSFDAAVELLRLDADGTRWEIDAHDLALDSRAFELTVRQPGHYTVGLAYRNTPSVSALGAHTPFADVGSGTLTLPPGWVRGDATGDLTTLAADLHGFDATTEREHIAAHASWWARHGWETSLDARHETRRGTDLIGGSFITRATLLPEPIDYRTDTVSATASYAASGWDVALRYLVSTFDARDSALEWDNPFLALHPSADVGRLALAPDNELQQLSADARYRTGNGIRIEGGASLGTGSQDATLLPATANPGLTSALPRTTTDATVDTQSVFARAAIPLPDRALLRVEARYDSRAVDTPHDAFTQVITDTYIAGTRTNIGYGYDKLRLKAEGDWRVGGVRLLARAEQVSFDRDYGASTDQLSLSVAGHGALFEVLDWSLEFGTDRRDTGRFVAIPGAAPQNPALSVFSYAALDRDRWTATLGASPTATSSFALRLEQRIEHYPDTALGLTDRHDTGVGFDASLVMFEDMSLGASYQRQVLATDQAGSQTFGAADWTGRSEDATEAIELSFEAPTITERLAVRARFVITDSSGAVTVDHGPAERFPETLSKLTQLLLQADYRIDERIALRIGLRFERLAVSDWSIAGVDPATVPNLLSTGQDQADVELDVIELGVRIDL